MSAPPGCVLCSGRLDTARGVPRGLGLLMCSTCGHVVSPSVAVPAGQADVLQGEHFGDNFAAHGDCWTRVFDRANARRVARLLRPLLPAGSRVLEIGPGRGALLSELTRSGYAAEGTDLSEDVARAVHLRTSVRVHVRSVEGHAASLGADRYGGIVMRHVLEHVPRPRVAVAAVSEMLVPGGVFYVAVPNLAAPEARLAGWSGYQPYHLHYFRPPVLRRILAEEGFEVVSTRTREPFSGWVNAAVNTLLTRSGGSGGPSGPSGLVVGTYNAIRLVIGSVLWPLRALQSAAGRGEELEIVARKARPL